MADNKDIKKKKDEKPAAAPITQKPPETASALHIPKPTFVGTWKVDDLPDAESEGMRGLNIRSVYPKEGETIEQAIDRELDIPQMMATIENSPPDEHLHPRHALTIARWKGCPSWLPKDVVQKQQGSECVVFIGGNRRTIAVKRLKKLFSTGHEVELVVYDEKGNEKREKVHKTYDHFAVEVYDNLSEEQWRHLQRKEFDRKQLKKGDIAMVGIRMFRKNIAMSEAELVNGVGATVFKEFYYAPDALAKGENPYHTGVQMLRRAAKLPPDIADAFVANLNRVPNAWKVNDKQLREFLKFYEPEVGFWDRRTFNTTKAKVKDIRLRPDMTTKELAELYDKIAEEDKEFLGGLSAGEKGSDRSDFLKKVWEFKRAAGVVGGGTGVGASKAATHKEMTALETGLQSTTVAKLLLSILLGKADAIDRETAVGLILDYEKKATEVLKANAADWLDAFYKKVNDTIRAKNAALQQAKEQAS